MPQYPPRPSHACSSRGSSCAVSGCHMQLRPLCGPTAGQLTSCHTLSHNYLLLHLDPDWPLRCTKCCGCRVTKPRQERKRGRQALTSQLVLPGPATNCKFAVARGGVTVAATSALRAMPKVLLDSLGLSCEPQQPAREPGEGGGRGGETQGNGGSTEDVTASEGGSGGGGGGGRV